MTKEDLFIHYCLTLVGRPYKWGGDDYMDGFDCSGAVQEILAAFGAKPKVDRTSHELWEYFVSPGNASKPKAPCLGTLCFFGGKTITHVGIAIDRTTMFEAAGGGSKTNTRQDAIEHNAYGRFRPINNRSDLKATLLPTKLSDFFLK